MAWSSASGVASPKTKPFAVPLASVASLQDHLDAVERKAIAEALIQAGGNRTAAARLLGISFRSMRYRMARLGMRE